MKKHAMLLGAVLLGFAVGAKLRASFGTFHQPASHA